MINSDQTKRRLNFITGEDFYFLTYELLILLDAVTTRTGAFKDCRKLAYLIQIVSSEQVLGVLDRYQGRTITNSADKELLFSSFTAGEIHKREVYKLLCALDSRGYLSLSRTASTEGADLVFVRDKIPREFIQSENFNRDRARAVHMKGLFARLSALSLETFLEKVYNAYGVKVWAL